MENSEFRELLCELDSRYHVPGCTKISKEIDRVVTNLKATVSSFLDSAQCVNICADIWTKKGMTTSCSVPVPGYHVDAIKEQQPKHVKLFV